MADYLEIQSTSFPDQKDHFNGLLESLTKKLWHQFAVKLEEIVNVPFFLSGDHLSRLFEGVVKSVASNLNQQSYVHFSIAASKQQADTEAGKKFLEGIAEAVAEDHQATLLCKMEIARLNVQLKDSDACKVLLDEGRKLMGAYMGIMDASVQSHLFLAAMEYHKVNGPAQDYFKNSLLYLTYTPLEKIPVADQVALAADVSLAAVLGKGIYNFGELLQHPVVTKLHGTPQQWLSDLLLAFNKGDIASFKTIYGSKSGSEERLCSSKEFLEEKIRIMALIEMVFSKDAHNRTISFEEVAATCDCKPEQVEHLLMKSFSLGVLTGMIDQVESKVRVKWVQPRVLDVKQLAIIRTRLTDWATQVSSAATYLESNAPELLVGH